MFKIVKFCLIIYLLIFTSCTRPPRIEPLTDDIPTKNLFDSSYLPSIIRGTGKVLISYNGDVYSGYSDLEWNKNGTFRANFYSPFGSLIASMFADSQNGTIELENKKSFFALDSTIDSIPFLGCGKLTFGELITAITGRIPEKFRQLFSLPCNILTKKSCIETTWKNDSVEIKLYTNRKSLHMKELSLCYFSSPKFSITYDDYKNRIARGVKFRTDDKNYISIRYERLFFKE